MSSKRFKERRNAPDALFKSPRRLGVMDTGFNFFSQSELSRDSLACRAPECAKLCSRRRQRGSADLKKVGLTRRGPPTCRHRRELLRNAEENFQRSHIPSHLTRRAKDGRPRRVSPTAYHLPFKNQNSTNINRQFFLRHAVGDKSAGCGDPALLGALPVTRSKLVSPALNFTNPLIYSIRLGPTN